MVAGAAAAWLDELQVAPGPPWHALGTRALGGGSWLLPDDEREAELTRKSLLLRTARDDVLADAGGTAEAAAELLELVAAATGAVPEHGVPPLEAAALLVQEDLCLLVRDGCGWRLAAGAVCFPSFWRVTDKVGLPITSVHEPVPAYAEELGARVDRVLDHLRPERPVWRRNWLVHDSDELHVPRPLPGHDRATVPDDLWLRSERQTLRRLPVSDAIAFTIRTQQVPLATVAQRPVLAAAMAAAIRSWSDELVAYRGARAWRAPLVAWLERAAG